MAILCSLPALRHADKQLLPGALCSALTAACATAQSSFCHVPLEQSALAFLPGARTRAELRETVAVLLGMAGLIGCATALAAAAVPSCVPGALTRDPALWPMMRSIAPQARRPATRLTLAFEP